MFACLSQMYELEWERKSAMSKFLTVTRSFLLPPVQGLDAQRSSLYIHAAETPWSQRRTHSTLHNSATCDETQRDNKKLQRSEKKKTKTHRSA
jgi:hypothetical protein